MSPDREQPVTDAFMALADSLVGPFDVVELLGNLTKQCANLLDVASAGLLLADRHGTLQVLAASSEQTRSLELFQLQCHEGPCLECFQTGTAVSVANLRLQTDRWPQFVAAAGALGFASVHAVPLRLHDQTLGALGLFGTIVGALSDDDLHLAQALAHIASVALVTGNAATDRDNLNRQLQTALNSRVVIEQAKGVIAQHTNTTIDEAFSLLRRYARDHNQKLSDIAKAVASRELPISLITDHARNASPRTTRTSND